MNKIDKKLILASKSPRRHQLLEPYFSHIEVIAKDVAECFSCTEPSEIVMELAKKKLADLPALYPNDIVVSGDTIVWFNGKIYGKPTDRQDAYRILSELSGNTHEVYSGFAVAYNGKIKLGYDCCTIKFKNLNAEMINDYIATGSPLDKAGAYGVQDGYVVEDFTGDINTIIGLPVKKVLVACEELFENE